MNKKRILSLLLSLFAFGAFAQESAYTEAMIQPQIKVSFLDSIKSSFIRNHEMACIDSVWIKELTNQDLFNTMQEDIVQVNPDEEVDFELSTEVLKQRLAKLDAKSPFNIEYSKALENVIKSYLKNRPRAYERLMAISEYYFPMFEEYLAKYNIPMELKYLAVVESALNPRAKSRVGATGLWQFMYPTGKQFNLDVNSYVDERSDPLKATEAACQYLSSLYGMFGDWDLVLASYNAGPGNVTKAIRRSGGYKNYWNIRKNLPKETQGYLPAFLATMYIYEYQKEHGINAKKAPITYFETDTIMVKRKMSFNQIAQLIDVPVEQLQLLNPIYKLDIVPNDSQKPHYIRLPKDKIGLFASNENAIYAFIDYEDSKRERPIFSMETAVASGSVKTKNSVKTHLVKRGDNLGAISRKYGVSVAEIKKWNKLKGNNIIAGQRLKIINTIEIAQPAPVKEAIAVKEVKKQTAKPVIDTQPQVIAPEEESSDEILASVEETKEKEETEIKQTISQKQNAKKGDYEKERLYIVQKGDSLFSIARKHPGVTVENLKVWNEIKGESIQPGMKLKVKGS